ncbi:hypothetical protein GOV04_00020 [Candidatus Woesearchaeota archaeon]|nr:hypothetical protein [Candidatus Woesearchaeota archaeon]
MVKTTGALVELELEKSRLNREKSLLVLNKAVTLYFVFLFLGVLGFVNHYINQALFNTAVILGLLALITGTVPYVRTMHFEEKNIEALINKLKNKKV